MTKSIDTMIAKAVAADPAAMAHVADQLHLVQHGVGIALACLAAMLVYHVVSYAKGR